MKHLFYSNSVSVVPVGKSAGPFLKKLSLMVRTSSKDSGVWVEVSSASVRREDSNMLGVSKVSNRDSRLRNLELEVGRGPKAGVGSTRGCEDSSGISVFISFI